MKTVTKYLASILSLVFCVVLSYGQKGNQSTPLKVTMCDLYEHPEQYAGRIIEVRASVAGNDLWIDDFQHKACPSWTQVIVVFPQQVKPTPGFNLLRDDSFTKFFEEIRRGRGVQATFEGRFDAAFVWRNHKRVPVGPEKGYGKKDRYGGRIVLHRLSDVIGLPGRRL